jgi:hypothetical protein
VSSKGSIKLTHTDDYERHLREPSQKLREDVRREFADEIKKLQGLVESKQIWAESLHEQLNKSHQDVERYRAKAADSDAKLAAVFQWITSNLSDGDDGDGVFEDGASTAALAPMLGVSRDLGLGHSGTSNDSNTSSDFGPMPPPQNAYRPSVNTFNASRMRRGGADLETQFQDWYRGSLVGHRGQAPAYAQADDDRM